MTDPAIYLRHIDGAGREAERLAVGALAAEAFGNDTAIRHLDDGRPVVDIPGIEISISHCRGCAVLAVCDRPVGVDVETDRQQLGRVAARVMSPAEVEYYNDELVRAWTLKEALYKAAHTPGLDFRRDIILPVDGSATATVLTPRPVSFEIVRAGWLSSFDAFISVVVRL